MIDEIILRAHTDDGMRLLEKLEPLIRKEWVTGVSVLDERTYDDAAYDMEDDRFCERWEHVIALDKHLAKYFHVSYFQISRIFDERGDVVGRRMGSRDLYHSLVPYRIIDTDMVHGDTIKLACRIFDTTNYTVPTIVKLNQDLIDMEDLFMDNSLLKKDNGDVVACNYMRNWKFFINRTSLPTLLYEPIKEIIKNARLEFAN